MQSRRAELNAEFRALSELSPLTFDDVFRWCLTRNTIWEPSEIVEMTTRCLRADPDDRWSRLALADAPATARTARRRRSRAGPASPSDPEARVLRVGDRARPRRRAGRRVAPGRGAGRPSRPGPAPRPDRPGPARRPRALRHFRAAYEPTPTTATPLRPGQCADDGRQRSRSAATSGARHDRLGTLIQRVPAPGATNDPKLLDHLRAACDAVDRLPEARAWYNIAVERNPFDTEAQQALYRLDAAIAAADKPH